MMMIGDCRRLPIKILQSQLLVVVSTSKCYSNSEGDLSSSILQRLYDYDRNALILVINLCLFLCHNYFAKTINDF